MQVTRLVLKNWRNFTAFDAPFQDVSYLLVPNASGKSNLLDAFRFLGDVGRIDGRGLQNAVSVRGGFDRIHCWNARKDQEVVIDMHVADDTDDGMQSWRYVLGFRPDPRRAQRVMVSREEVWLDGRKIVDRPDELDREDPLRLAQTRLEQLSANQGFRRLAEFFGDIAYFHLVPQLLKFSGQLGASRLENDPFGQGLLERIDRTHEKTRSARLRKMEKALMLAIPGFSGLRFRRDENGRPHLEARYQHDLSDVWQGENSFSDGTLSLLGLLWSLLEGNALLLLEEPEIYLNEEVVRHIPVLIDRVQRNRRLRQQVIISTHSEALLENRGIDGRGVIVLAPAEAGTQARTLADHELKMLCSGLSVAEVVLPQTRPQSVGQMVL